MPSAWPPSPTSSASSGASTSFEDVLAMDDIDIIDICTPPGLHYPMVTAALKAGKHVICEKPLVGSLAQVDDDHRARKESARAC